MYVLSIFNWDAFKAPQSSFTSISTKTLFVLCESEWELIANQCPCTLPVSSTRINPFLFLSRHRPNPRGPSFSLGLWLQWKSWDYKSIATLIFWKTSLSLQRSLSWKNLPWAPTWYQNLSHLMPSVEQIKEVIPYCVSPLLVELCLTASRGVLYVTCICVFQWMSRAICVGANIWGLKVLGAGQKVFQQDQLITMMLIKLKNSNLQWQLKWISTQMKPKIRI